MSTGIEGIGLVGGVILLLGSPSIGYIILRCVSVSSAQWQGWKRMMAAAFVGGGWWAGNFIIMNPLLPTLTVTRFVEYTAYLGGGLFMLTTLTSLTNRFVISRALQRYELTHARATSAYSSEKMDKTEGAVPYGRAYGELSYKASQLRAPSTTFEKTLEEPMIEKGEDVLQLLKDENFQPPQLKPFESGEWKAGEEEPKTRPRAPMRNLGELEGFEETLAQLQRDLKDFNENVTGTRSTKHGGKKHE